jgi:hypothetical protein
MNKIPAMHQGIFKRADLPRMCQNQISLFIIAYMLAAGKTDKRHYSLLPAKFTTSPGRAFISLSHLQPDLIKEFLHVLPTKSPEDSPRRKFHGVPTGKTYKLGKRI